MFMAGEFNELHKVGVAIERLLQREAFYVFFVILFFVFVR